jgi:hypothetical protein
VSGKKRLLSEKNLHGCLCKSRKQSCIFGHAPDSDMVSIGWTNVATRSAASAPRIDTTAATQSAHRFRGPPPVAQPPDPAALDHGDRHRFDATPSSVALCSSTSRSRAQALDERRSRRWPRRSRPFARAYRSHAELSRGRLSRCPENGAHRHASDRPRLDGDRWQACERCAPRRGRAGWPVAYMLPENSAAQWKGRRRDGVGAGRGHTRSYGSAMHVDGRVSTPGPGDSSDCSGLAACACSRSPTGRHARPSGARED